MIGVDMDPLVAAGLRLVLAAAVSYLVYAVGLRLLARLAERVRLGLAARLIEAGRRPAAWLILLLGVQGVFTGDFGLGPELTAGIRKALQLASIALVTWLLVRLIDACADHILARHDVSSPDNLEARRVHTQVTVIERTLVGFVVLVGVAVALMTFPRIRELGASLLVSAGFAGLAVGLAARPVLENLIAGLQLALAQPIRIDDVVVIEGDFGWVEEITATYVVVRVWDQRRIIVPFSKFISEPFQNWTRRSAQLLGTVYLYVDYTLPVAALRAELERICEACPAWDRRVCVLQVTDATERSMQLRALVSAASAGQAWDLRVHVREQLIAFLQREYPAALPRVRLELGDREDVPAAPAGGSA